jgi:hypothetical protein
MTVRPLRSQALTQRDIPESLRPAYKAARKSGWSITRTSGSHHVRWQPPSGPAVFGSSSPRGGCHAVENIIGKLRRAGLDC